MSASTRTSLEQWSTPCDPGSETIELATQIPMSSSTLGRASFLAPLASEETEPQPNIDLDVRSARNEVTLAPVDRGFRAWSFVRGSKLSTRLLICSCVFLYRWPQLAGAFVVELIVWSFPFAFGIFLSAYLEDAHWTSQKDAQSLLPLVGTLSTGIIYCSGHLMLHTWCLDLLLIRWVSCIWFLGAFLNPLLDRYPRHRRTAMWIGGSLCGLSLLAASYATKVGPMWIVCKTVFKSSSDRFSSLL